MTPARQRAEVIHAENLRAAEIAHAMSSIPDSANVVWLDGLDFDALKAKWAQEEEQSI